jgi:hypothetical protein
MNLKSNAMDYKISFLFIAIAVLLTGCYHAQVTTGLEPSDEVYEDKWAAGFIHGLVPPDIVEAEHRCPNGVARVETQLSFMNQFVTILSFGIYSPMQITVTCAAASASAGTGADQTFTADRNASNEAKLKTIEEAVHRSAELAQPVYIEFR